MFGLNINAEEFVPSKESHVMIESEWFDKLEKEFVKNNAWLFEDCPLEDLDLKFDIKNDLILHFKEYDEKYEEKFKNTKFIPKLKTIPEENETVKKMTYADTIKYSIKNILKLVVLF